MSAVVVVNTSCRKVHQRTEVMNFSIIPIHSHSQQQQQLCSHLFTCAPTLQFFSQRGGQPCSCCCDFFKDFSPRSFTAADAFQFEALLHEEADSRGCCFFVSESRTVFFLTLPGTGCLPPLNAPHWTVGERENSLARHDA